MTNHANDDGAVCTKCGTVVESREDWDAHHRHGAR